MKKIISLLLAFHLCLCALSASETGKLHAILVTDLNAANIESIVEKDLARLLGEIARISKYTQLEVREKIFLGSTKDPKRLHKYIKRLHVNSNDVVLFYFSGHGFRTPQEERAWPSLAFEEADVGIRFEEIASLLANKQARLCLFFADCCNNVIQAKNAPQQLKLKAKNKNYVSWVQETTNGYHKLFVESKGILMVSAASASEYTQGSDTGSDSGSFFTKALVMSIQEACQNSASSPSWQKVMDKVQNVILDFKTQYPEEFSEQHPYILNAVIE